MVLLNLLRSGGQTAAATMRRHAFSTRATSRLNVAVVGTGRMGKIRLAGMQSDPRLKVAAIIDPITAASATEKTAWESQFQTKVFADVTSAAQELESDGVGIDGLWIATPTPSHLPVIQDTLTSASTSLANLKAIGVEKPVGGTLEDIDRAYKLCSDKRVHLFCSFQRRFDPSYEALRRACVDNAQIGKLQSIHTVFRDHPCPPIEFLKTGGDPFHDLAVHDIDYVCTLVGEYPTKVYAFGTSLSPELREVNVMDKASVWLEFPNSDVICTMDLSRSALYGYDQRVEVSGEEGMLQVVNPPKTSLVRASVEGVTSDVLSHSFPERFREAYVLEMDAFVDVLTGTRPPIVHWNAARMATIISEAARIAAVEKKVVTIQYGKTKQNSPNSDPHIEYEYVY